MKIRRQTGIRICLFIMFLCMVLLYQIFAPMSCISYNNQQTVEVEINQNNENNQESKTLLEEPIMALNKQYKVFELQKLPQRMSSLGTVKELNSKYNIPNIPYVDKVYAYEAGDYKVFACDLQSGLLKTIARPVGMEKLKEWSKNLTNISYDGHNFTQFEISIFGEYFYATMLEIDTQFICVCVTDGNKFNSTLTAFDTIFVEGN